MKKKFIALMVGCALTPATDSFAEKVSPRRLLEVVDLGNPVVSPDGHHVAFRIEQADVDRNTYDATWYVQDMDDESIPRRVGDGGIPLRDSAGISEPSPAVWSPDSRWVFYRAFLDGRVDVWKAAADGSAAQPVTLDPADVQSFSLSSDGKVLRYRVGSTRDEVIAAEQAEYDNGIRVDDSVPVGQPLFRSGLVKGRLATQRYDNRDGQFTFDLVPLLADVPNPWKAVDLDTGKRWELIPSDIPKSQPDDSGVPRGTPTPERVLREPRGKRIALLTRSHDKIETVDSSAVQLSVSSGAGSDRPIICTADLCTGKPITDIQWSPGGDAVLFTITDRNEGYAQSIARWNVQTGEVNLVASAHGFMNGGDRYGLPSACGISATALACVVAEASLPPRLERIDLTTSVRRVLFDPNAGLARDLAKIAPARMLRWTDPDGQMFTGQFFPARASTTRPPPLFVNYYSCRGFLRGGLGDEWPLATLAEEGISSLCINSPPFQFNATKRYNMGLSAVRSVIALLASKGEIDATKVGMGGLSFGSEVAMWVAAKSNLLAAVSTTSPVTSPNYYLLGSLRGEKFFENVRRVWQLGSPEETPEHWRTISPLFDLERIRAPLLFQMPEQEYIDALDYTIPLLRRHQADLFVFPNEPHQKFQPKHKLAVYERNVDWFRFWLQGYEDPAPAKAKQYENWRLMRSKKSSWAEK